MLLNLILGKLSTLDQEMKCQYRMMHSFQRIQSMKVRELLTLILVLIHLLQQLPQAQGLQRNSHLNPGPPPENHTSSKSLLNSTFRTLISPTLISPTSISPTSTSPMLNGMSYHNMTEPTQGNKRSRHNVKRDLKWTWATDENYTKIEYDFELELRKEKLLDTAYHNEWYRWAEYTVKQTTKSTCVLCSPSPLKKLTIVPNQYDNVDCARFYSQYCDNQTGQITPYCPAECLAMLGSQYYHKFYNQKGWGSECKKLDVRIDPAKRETPKNYVLDTSFEYECFNKTKGR